MMKKVVLVTGASSGIGLSIANYLHFQKKYIVYGTSRKSNNSSDFSFNLVSLMLQTNHLLKIVFLIF